MKELNDLISKACLASELGKKGITVDLQMLSQVRDEFFAIQRRAEAAEAKLAELEKQEPVAEVNHDGTFYGFKALENMPEGNYPLFTRPAPAASLAELVPDEMTFDEAVWSCRENTGIVAKSFQVGWNACRAAILANLEKHK